MGDRATKKQKASSSFGGRRRRRSPTPSPSSSPPTPNNDLFSSDEQKHKYDSHFVNREILESKYLEDGYFEGRNFQFYDILAEAGLTKFVSLRRHYQPELVRVFYSNMLISDTGVIRSEVKGVKIRVSPTLFQQLTNLPPDGVCYEGKLVDEWKEQYDSVTARQLVCRDDAVIQSRILAGHMKVQPRILHYVLTRVLIPRATNIGQASEEDIMLLWAFLNSIQINWGHLIRYKMKRELRENAKLPYPHLITIFMEHFEVPTDTNPISEVKFKQKMGSEVVASFGYVQNDDGEWVPKGNAPHPPLQQGQDQQGSDDEQGSSSTTLNNVINRIEQLQTFVGTRFDAFETRFHAFENRFENMDMVISTRFDALQSRVGNIEEQLQHLQSASENNPNT